MSGIFSRRQRPASNPSIRMPQSTAPAPTPSSSAAAAATQAFMKNQQSNTALSAAAAATALRSHPSPTTQVGNVQTKRMVRRGSTSSNGSAPSTGPPTSQLQRRGSSGSMTERTFRSPSPNRTASPSTKVATVPPDAPPIPDIPADIPEIPPKSHKRAASLEYQSRISSPPPRTGGRGVSLDRANPPSSAGPGPSPLSKITELDREGSQRSSVNFSRPMSPTNSPTFGGQLRPKTQGGWFSGPRVSNAQPRKTPFERPKTAIGLTPVEVSGVQQAIQSAADRPITPKKKKRFPGIEGSRLAAGTMGAKPTGTALDRPESPRSVQTPTTAPPRVSTATPVAIAITTPTPVPVPVPAPVLAPIASQDIPMIQAAVPSPGSTSADERSPVDSSSEASPTGRQIRAAGVLTKQPSVVREEPELEKQAEDTPSANTSRKIDASKIRSPTDIERPPIAIPKSLPPVASEQLGMRSTSEVLDRTDSKESDTSVRHARHSSLSPVRTPHFSLKPIELENGVKHQPPPRSVSPGKSALKRSPSSSVRTASPATNSAERGASLSPARSQSPQQKKSARVSFDEGPATIIPGLEASKHAPSTNTKLLEEPDFEDVYTPRPALPSFGSIRGRKRDDDEVPSHPKVPESPVEATPSSISSSRTLVDPGHSKDLAIGGILAQDFATKTAERKAPGELREEDYKESENLPLPPQVTSVEGSGYASDSDASAYGDSVPPTPNKVEEEVGVTEGPGSSIPKDTVVSAEPSMEKATIAYVEPSTITEVMNTESRSTIIIQQEPWESEAVPEIEVHPATPGADGEDSFVIPGAFPSWETESELDEKELPEEVATTSQAETPHSATPPVVTAPPEAIVAVPSIQVPTQDETESETESIYSDAAEDPSELFTSIDAILGSPISPPGQAIGTDRGTQSSSVATSSAHMRSTAERDSTVPNAAVWEDATKYWRDLNDKRKQKIEEKAAVEDETDDSDDTIQRLPTPPIPKRMREKTTTLAPIQQDPVRTQPDPIVTPATRQAQAESASRQPVTSPEPRQPILKKSMQAQHERSFSDETHMMPMTLRGSNKGLEASKYAHQPEPRGALHKKNAPATIKSATPASPTLTKAPIPPSMQLQRRNSDDSVSSFQRRRPRPRTAGPSSIALRQTLRGPAPLLQPTTRTTLRTQPGPTSPPPRTMRTSLRPSTDSDPPSLRGAPKTKKRSALSPTRLKTLGRSSKQKSKTVAPLAATAATPAIPAGIATKFRSRFGKDSDDDEAPEQGPRAMASRFADSDDSDDESDRGLAPVRGIPRRSQQEDAESEVLPGEDDSDVDAPPPPPGAEAMAAATTLARQQLRAQGAIESGPTAAAPPPTTADASAPASGLAASKYASSDAGAAPPPAHRRRWSLFGAGRGRGSSLPPVLRAAAPAPPKLQRRATPSGLPGVEEDAWPLPAEGGELERPNTSDGATASSGVRFSDRPDMGTRRSTADELGEGRRRLSKGGEPVVSLRTGKVKRFGRLRKAFGLKD